jgi:hypothetical protein
MYRITLTSRSVDNFTIVIEEESREVFSERLKTFVGPNSGWYANGLPSYVGRFWNDFIDTCLKA